MCPGHVLLLLLYTLLLILFIVCFLSVIFVEDLMDTAVLSNIIPPL